mmetsp:Transcript_27990/g.31124  ORF Transcript_27990/g.31124 Transcript_27990/m.31124 type:complete len:248 (+) Transcript_27990:70-813(+)|eukprot:CAMPEP_0168525104 /NCGR_PEP_ID=MMETSP0405-20121227/11097_1 /TAXON_ID=498012 /ORGANISM="Trichosphaerium sp, Strain Am-I-7 wt" /LENGTH=247 /DNA_ID=CAMNT_0008547539 /DNA_START=50 /DNA_END=793 /DNA_ORIENTATION=+
MFITNRIVFSVGGIFKEIGNGLERFGMRIQGNFACTEQLSRHRRVVRIGTYTPKIGTGTFIAPNACVIANVELGDNSSVWYGAVVRGDVNTIKIGKNTSICERTSVHVSRSDNIRTGSPCLIGDNVTIGQACVIHGCTIGDNSLIEEGVTLLDGVQVSSGSIVAAGSVVLGGTVIPAGEKWGGAPAKSLGKLTDADVTRIKDTAANYLELAVKHDENHMLTPYEHMRNEYDARSGVGREEHNPEKYF